MNTDFNRRERRGEREGTPGTEKVGGRLVFVIRREILQCFREKQQIHGATRVLGIGRETLYNKIKASRSPPRSTRRVASMKHTILLMSEFGAGLLLALVSYLGTALVKALGAI